MTRHTRCNHRIRCGITALPVIALAVASSIGVAAPKPTAPAATTAASARAAEWREDLRFLATELPRRHQELFVRLTREQWAQGVAALDREIPTLTDPQVIAGIMRLVASVGDAHTQASPPARETARVFPLRLYWFADGIFITAVTEESRPALGARLVAIAGRPIADICAAVTPLIAHENDAQVRNVTPKLLVQPVVLQALGVITNPRSARFEFAGPGGATFGLDLAAMPWFAYAKLLQADVPVHPPLYLRDPAARYWFEYLEDTQTLYCKYNSCVETPELPFGAFCSRLFAVADAKPVRRFVLDLRDNGGGRSPLAEPLIAGIKERPAINRKGALFVIIGRATFSSAVLNAVDLQNQTAAIFVGEPTGGKPNHFGEVQTFRLPNSRMEIAYSTKHFAHSPVDTPSLTPDVAVEYTSADYFSGRDPALEAILGYRGQTP